MKVRVTQVHHFGVARYTKSNMACATSNDDGHDGRKFISMADASAIQMKGRNDCRSTAVKAEP